MMFVDYPKLDGKLTLLSFIPFASLKERGSAAIYW